jgi:hypothetical protein
MLLSWLSILLISWLCTVTVFNALRGGHPHLASVELVCLEGVELACDVCRVFLLFGSTS